MRKRLCLCALLALTMSTPAMAEESPHGWTGQAEFGMVATGGNSETRNTHVRTKLVYDHASWRHTATFESLNTSNRATTTAERYLATSQVNLKISIPNYLFLLVSYSKDRFSGFNQRVTETTGIGHRLVKSTSINVDMEGGVGLRQSTVSATSDHQDEPLGRAATRIEWTVNGHASLNEYLSIDFGDQSSISKSTTSLTTRLAGHLSTKLTYVYKYTSTVPTGTNKSDYSTAVSLVYSF